MRTGDVAIIGMACVFPEAADLRAYWRNVVNGVDAIRPLPQERWPGSRNTRLPSGHFAHIGCERGGFIPTPFLFDPLRFRVPPAAAEDGDVDQFVLLHMLGDALDDAGIGPSHPARLRSDVIVGRGGYTSNKMMEIFLRADMIDRLCALLERRFTQLSPSDIEALAAELQAGLGEPDVDAMASSIPNLVASRASNRLDLRGAAYCVDAACASSLIAVEQAVNRLREGHCDLALACGINFTHVPSFWYLFTRILAVSPSGSIRPFDRRADGLLIGEGAGALVLKRLEDAARDGDLVRAVIKGAGSASDGGEAGILAPSSEGQVRALEAAYRDAGVDPASVDLLEAHGTATVQGDAAEIRSIRTFFGPRRTEFATRVMGSVKSMIGHTMPAAGVASLIKAAMALNAKVLPPSLHCQQPHPELAELPFYVNQRARPWTRAPQDAPRRAGVNAFGFGGINAHVVLEEATPGPRTSRVAVPAGPTQAAARPVNERPPCPELLRPSELLAFSGPSPRELAARLRRAARFIDQDRAGFDLEDLAWTLVGEFEHGDPCKLALVTSREDRPEADLSALAARLGKLADTVEQGGQPPREDGLFFGTDIARHAGRVVALFPGLAFPGLVGHYPEHLMTFCLHFPRFREVFDLVETRDEHPDDALPTSFLLDPPDHLPESERTRLRQRFALVAPLADAPSPERQPAPDERLLSGMGMLTSNWSGWTLLEPFAIPFEMVCGQSVGEISALCASGALDFRDVIPRLWRFLSEDPRIVGLGSLAFVGTTQERLAPVLAQLSDVCVALHLSQETLIVGGPDDQLAEMVRLLRERGVIAQRLPFPPVHTPRMEAKQRDLVALDGTPLPLAAPRLAIYSNITAEPMPGEADELRRLIAANVSRPVRFWQTLRRMYDDGARLFVQVGTGTLAGNVRTILPEPDVATVALDVDYRHPVQQLQHLCGTLLGNGVPVELRALFEARAPRTLPLDAPRPQREVPRGALALVFYRPPLQNATGPSQPAVPDRTAPPRVQAQTPAQAPVLPFVGRVLEYEPGRRLVHLRRFSLDEDLYLADHAFVTCAELRPLRERYPVVPLTVTLELLAQTAACLAPGLGLLSIEDVRAKRWIALDGVEALDVRVEATAQAADGDGTVAVHLQAFDGDACVATAVIRLGASYRMTLDLRFSELTGAAAFPLPVERLYAEGYFFHGPQFHCLTAIHTRGDQGVVGEMIVTRPDRFLRSNAAPQLLCDPIVLDGVGQLLGTMFFDRNLDILPVGVEKIEFYGPPPPPGTRVPVRLEIVDFDLDQRRVTAIAEVQDGSGHVWFRVAGWRDLLFRYTKRLQLARRNPERHTLAEEPALPGLPADAVAVVLPRTTLRDARPDRLARLYLNQSELATFQELQAGESRQREWLMGRMAVKDAARLWISRRTGQPMLHPLCLSVSADAKGRPLVTLDAVHGPSPAISLAHTDRAACAIAGSDPIGIDIEPEDGGKRLSIGDFATAEEIHLLRALADGADAGWTTRLWCGKEAAAKALGTGLGGRPRAFAALTVEPDGGMIVRGGEPPRHLRVTTHVIDGLMLAVASAAQDLRPSPPLDPQAAPTPIHRPAPESEEAAGLDA